MSLDSKNLAGILVMAVLLALPGLAQNTPSLDASWGTKGLAMTGAGFPGQVRALAEGPAGSLYVARTATAKGTVALTKLGPKGLPDASFATQGTLLLKLDDESIVTPHAMAVQADGKILILCQSDTTLPIFRVLPNGAPDMDFNAGAQAPYTQYANAGQGRAGGLLVLPDGGFAFYGTRSDVIDNTSFALLSKFKADGTLDTDFGANGTCEAGEGVYGRLGQITATSGLVLRADGSYALLGWNPWWVSTYTHPAYRSLVAGISAEGVVTGFAGCTPEGFDAAGNAIVPYVDDVGGMLLDAQGNLVVAGSFYHEDTEKLCLARFEADGTPQGLQMTDLGMPGKLIKVTGLWQRPGDQRFFVAGTAESQVAPARSFVACFRPDFTLEPAFGTQGVITLPSVTGKDHTLAAFMPAADGKLYVGGYDSPANTTAHGTGASCMVARLAADALAATPWSPPVVTTKPPALTVAHQSEQVTLSLGVQPGNTLTPGYTWWYNGQYAGGGPAFTIPNMSSFWGGTYSVEVWNGVGSVLVDGIRVQFNKAPAFRQGLQAFTGGGVYPFYVTVTGAQPLTYEWKHNGDTVRTVTHTSNNILEGDSDRLDVNVDPAHAGDYSVTVSNAFGSATSGPVKLQSSLVIGPMVSPTLEMSASASGTAGIAFSVQGVPPYTFQWQKNGENYGDPFTQSNGYPSLSLPAQPASNGDYRCLVSNAQGGGMTDVVHVTIYSQPVVRLDSAEQLFATPYDAPAFSARVYGTQGPVTLQWQRNGVNIAGAPSADHFIPQGVTPAAIAGSYRVILRTGGHAYTSNAVNVAAAADVTATDPEALVKEVAQGGTTTLTAYAAGGSLSYRWSKLGSDAPLTSPKFSGAGTRTLKITRADAVVDAGVYLCYVTCPGAPVETRLAAAVTLVVETVRPSFNGTAFLPVGMRGIYYNSGAIPVTGVISTRDTSVQRVFAHGLPPGLAFDPLAGAITGYPLASGTWRVSFTAANGLGTVSAGPFPLVIKPLVSTLRGTYMWSWLGQGATGPAPYVATLTIASTGSYTLSVRGLGSRVSLTGVFIGPGPEGLEAYPTLTLDGQSKTFYCHWDASGLEVYSNSQPVVLHHNPWTAANPATAFAGPFTTALAFNSQPGLPAGTGYATFNVASTGTLTFAGRLPDGTAFTIPGFVEADGTVAVLTSWLYNFKGMLWGQFTLAPSTAPGQPDNAANGSLRFVRPGSTLMPVEKVDNPWFNAVDTTLAVSGARHLPPGSGLLGCGPLMMNAGSASPNISVSANDGPLAAAAVVDATVKPTVKGLQPVAFPAFIAGSPMKWTSLSFTPATGLFSGAFTRYMYNGVTHAVTSSQSFTTQGVAVRDDAALPGGKASGFFLGSETLTLHDQLVPAKAVKVTLPVSGSVGVR